MPHQIPACDLRRPRPGRTARMVDRQWTRRLCRRDHRRQPDPALSWTADCAGRITARAPAHSRQGRCHAHCGRSAHGRCSRTDGKAAPSLRRVTCASEAFISTTLFRCGLTMSESDQIEARIWMEPGAHTTYAAWRLCPGAEALERCAVAAVILLTNDRDHHGTTRPSAALIPTFGSRAMQSPRHGCRALFPLTFARLGGNIAPTRDMVPKISICRWRRARPVRPSDNHLCVGEATLPLIPGEWRGIVGSLEPDPSPDLAAALVRRRRCMTACSYPGARSVPDMASPPAWIAQLRLPPTASVFPPACRSFRRKSVIAGYPWFGDWGRDTMISLPGLTLATGRPAIGAAHSADLCALRQPRACCPTCFPAPATSPSTTPPMRRSGSSRPGAPMSMRRSDHATLARGLPGARPTSSSGIAGVPATASAWIRRDGLLSAGEPGVQLTWMDAKVGDWVVTPRIGKPVEINALWYNALCIMARLPRRLASPRPLLAQPAEAARAASRASCAPTARVFTT